MNGDQLVWFHFMEKRMRYLGLIFLLSMVAVRAEKLNVVFILIDDLGWKDVGYNGSRFYETPEMDRLSREWMRFDHYYAASPMCSPTRVSIMTGKSPARHGVTQWLDSRSLPITVLGGGLPHGRHIVAPEKPLSSLFLSMANRLEGANLPSFQNINTPLKGFV